MSLDRLWADWRSDYVSGATAASETPGGAEPHGCVLCNLVAATDDAEALVLERTEHTITVMNLYPYGSGHLMVAPQRHVSSFVDLDDDEVVAIARAQVRALHAIGDAYSPEGGNVGANLGRAGGAGIPGHLHVHVLPRWSGDTNFMTSIGETRVLPESLRVGYDKLLAAWPR
jgi:ATP adenylyltransferase